MKNNKNYTQDFFMWLGEDGEAIEVTREEFERLQKEWNGARPSDY